MDVLLVLFWLVVGAVFLLIAGVSFYILFGPLFLPQIKAAPSILSSWKLRPRAGETVGEEVIVRAMTKRDIPQVVSLMVDAFLTYPSFEYLTDDMATRRRLLEFIFPGALTAALQYGYCWVACRKNATSEICGEVLYYPEGVDLSIRDLLLNGIVTFPLHFGWQMTKDLLHIVLKQDEWKQARFPDSKGLAYVDFLSSRVSYHGQGIGSQLLEKTNDSVHEVQKVPLVLNTWQPHEVQFYTNRGFKLVDTVDMPCKRNGKVYHCYWMVKTLTEAQQ